jgi:hypothetical protein
MSPPQTARDAKFTQLMDNTPLSKNPPAKFSPCSRSKEAKRIRERLRHHFPNATEAAHKKATIAACYGASPEQIASIYRHDAEQSGKTLTIIR